MRSWGLATRCSPPTVRRASGSSSPNSWRRDGSSSARTTRAAGTSSTRRSVFRCGRGSCRWRGGRDPYLPNLVWGQADQKSCVAALREAAAGGETVGERRAAARARMAADFSTAAIGTMLRRQVEAIDWTVGTPDGLSPTALNSLALHVPPNPARAGIAWPARLPTFTVAQGGASAAWEALLGQVYPFWELCVVSAELPAGTAATLRMRTLDPACFAGPPEIAAAEGGSGAWLLLLPGEAVMAPDGLLAIARALDMDEPPDMISFGAVPLATDGPLAVRKAALLSAWARAGTLEDALARVAEAGTTAHLAGVMGGQVATPAGAIAGGGANFGRDRSAAFVRSATAGAQPTARGPGRIRDAGGGDGRGAAGFGGERRLADREPRPLRQRGRRLVGRGARLCWGGWRSRRGRARAWPRRWQGWASPA